MKLALQWPRTLASRLWLVFLVGLILAQSLTFAAQYYERYQSTKTAMLGNFEHDTATSIAILDRLPADERLAWTKRLQRRNYDYLLREHDPGIPLASNDLAATAAQSLQVSLGSNYDLTFVEIPGPQQHFQAQVRLADGSPVTIDVRPSVKPLSPWLPFVLVGQLVLLIGCTWLAVRIAIRPLSRLAEAVENLDPNAHPVQLDESGPREVAYAARAFNSMQARIAAYLKERMQLLAAISHDLQTPITRMKLRAEFMDDSLEKDKLGNDLNEIEHLVREGVAYARSVHGATEASCRISLDSFLDSLVCDYQDTGREVSLRGTNGAVIETRPHALRRILVNLVDNALKYAGTAEVEISGDASTGVTISVLDRGPGIPEEILAEVVKPFYRVESSRNRSTGGTGLGLAIAQQLTVAIGGALSLRNRDGGGLCVTLDFGLNR
ncbi:HAMP domain-containing protein [Pseudomonas sp. ICMP22404]|uniref:ATP-binding protein n=1 Tax=Pseudomonas TaxID=286 RepID=UPI001119BD63|nr:MULTISPECIES: ATP-binding protein [Pseudomonas]MCI0992370.1 HAMP domain-containing protein [Pseudomonas corrugata]NUT65801.1 HAMP domain-containing protein [Pseudomonas corrugata]TNF85650.1 HAMP domain-containing protein [Pseudomonas sp. ICMP22404]